MTTPVLPLKDLHKRHPGLTPSISQSFFEAASVCLERHHSSPTNFTIEQATASTETDVLWEPVGNRVRAAHANSIDATEAGAYGMCLAAIEQTAGLVAIQRAETMSGADYYVAPIGSEIDDLEVAQRFEISGVDRGQRQVCDSRLKAKVRQTEKPKHSIPAIAAVTGFQQQVVLISPLNKL